MPICPIDSGRYGTDKMMNIFDEETRLQYMLDVESAVARAQADIGIIPQEAAEEIITKATTKNVTVQECKETEDKIGHDIMALVKTLTRVCTGQGRKWVHFGLTSNDVLDTATGLQIRDALRILEESLGNLVKVMIRQANKYKTLIVSGRTHGQQAGVVTLGLKFAVWIREFVRHLDRLSELKSRVAVGKVLGVVGTGAALGKDALKIQDLALGYLGLQQADMVTQVVQRDNHAELFSVLANIASSLDKIGVEIRNLQRTEIGELMEPFKEDSQVGSSAMPAKRNPVKCERVCSLAKLLRSFTITAYENIPLWHERDLTNSANERITLPFAFILLDDMVNTMTKVLDGLKVFPQNIERNLTLGQGLILAERISTELSKRGMGRQVSHELIRLCSMKVYREGISFKKALLAEPKISSLLNKEDIDKLLDYRTYLGVTHLLIEDAINKTKKELQL